ncbi:MAG: peptide ABC transporter substrate-binding protein [Betaproteobacteria bacterium]|nr:peptide ABC transporter substrate-binding protein [Betaproteobacteria bacterium]
MRGFKLHQPFVTAASVAALTTIAAMATLAPSTAYAQRTITIVLPEEPDSLDNCNSARSAVGRVIRQNVNETLIELDPNDSTLKPRLATAWKQVDATTWRFTLRRGIKYSDGTPLTPEAIASSFDKALSPKLDCNARTKMFSGFPIKVQKVDDTTIDIITPRPDPILPVRMTTLTVGYPKEPIRVMNNSVGTGPYMIERYTANSEIVLKRNPHYWGKPPQLDGARYVWRKESAVAAAMVRVGEAHIATNITHEDAKDAKTDFAYPNSETNYLRIESLVPPFNDKRVRLALNYAVNRTALHGSIIPKQAQIATQMVIPRIAGHNHALNKQRYEYSPERAKKLLAEARAAGVKTDTPIELICRINQWENTTETCEAIMAMYTAVGFNMKLKMLEVSLWNQHNAHPNKGPHTPGADANLKNRGPVLLGHMHDNNVGDPIFSMFPKYGCKAQTSSHCIPDLDKKIEQAAQTPNGPKRTKLWEETMAVVHNEALDVFLFHMVGFARVSPKINFVPTAATNSEVLLEQVTFK